ncbi:TPA: hypothetical protein OW286_002546 [Citrobacter freundii]|uniref:hypothetical protein n=1 Tax=Citrobacter meridianamericanus TaxID=2894201 RepID=UPI00228C137E|nr:hypothetical protein [Citrobacter freundii]
MLLITSSLCDVLTPSDELDIPFYENFISQYSEITVSAIVAQLNLDPDSFDMPKSEFNAQINELIEGIPSSAMKMRKAFPFMSMGAHIDQGELVQSNEKRTFVSDYFTERSQQLGISNQEHVVNALNASAYLSYFGLFEGILKSLHLQRYPDDQYKTGNKDTIKKFLKKYIEFRDISDVFENELRARSKFYNNFKTLEHAWGLLNFIRNTQTHQNSNYGDKEKTKLNTLYKNLLDVLHDAPDNELLMLLFTQAFDPIIEQVNEYGFLQFNNTLENFVRNTSVFVMESLYVCISSKSQKSNQ